MRGYAGVVPLASNIRVDNGVSGEVTAETFLAMYPQFDEPTVPFVFLDMILSRANESIQEARWHKYKTLAVCLFAAHYCTLYLKSAVPEGVMDPATIAGKGESKGTMTSKSVGSVSVSFGSAEGASDLAGYGSWKDTVYGQQLASMARLFGAGMMVIR